MLTDFIRLFFFFGCRQYMSSLCGPRQSSHCFVCVEFFFPLNSWRLTVGAEGGVGCLID